MKYLLTMALALTLLVSAGQAQAMTAVTGELAWAQMEARGPLAVAPLADVPAGWAAEDGEPPPLPDLVIAWTSAGKDVTLNFWQKGGEDVDDFRKRVKDTTDWMEGLFPPDKPASSG